MSGKLICFIGTDGSGKSTVAERLRKRLEQSGGKCQNVWAAYDLRFFRVIIKTAKYLLMKNDSPYKAYKEYKKEMQQVSKNRLFLATYKLLVFLEYWTQIIYKVRLPLLLGKTVLCDRYVYDVVVNISSNLDLEEKLFVKMLKRWLQFFPSPGLVFFISVPPEVSLSRKSDIPDIEYIKRRLFYYGAAARHWPIAVIDGTLPLSEIDAKVQDLVVSIDKRLR